MTANDLRVWHSIFDRAGNISMNNISIGPSTAEMLGTLFFSLRTAIAEEIKVLDKEEWKNNT